MSINTLTFSSLEYASAMSHSFPLMYEAEYFPSAVPYSPRTQQMTCSQCLKVIVTNTFNFFPDQKEKRKSKACDIEST